MNSVRGHMRFSNQTVIVTGGGRGIGAAIATRFSSEGASLVVVDRDGAAAETTVRALPASDRALALEADIGAPADRDRMLSETRNIFGPPDILVNNAGIMERVGLPDVTPE